MQPSLFYDNPPLYQTLLLITMMHTNEQENEFSQPCRFAATLRLRLREHSSAFAAKT
jgi:hypothetical protein